MLRDANEAGNDRMILENYTMDDIDIPTLERYRIMFKTDNPDHVWNAHLIGDQRYSDRLTCDGTWENNLFNFIRMVLPKLTGTTGIDAGEIASACQK